MIILMNTTRTKSQGIKKTIDLLFNIHSLYANTRIGPRIIKRIGIQLNIKLRRLSARG